MFSLQMLKEAKMLLMFVLLQMLEEDRVMSTVEAVQAYKDVVDEFVASHDDFFDVNFIYAPPRL